MTGIYVGSRKSEVGKKIKDNKQVWRKWKLDARGRKSE